MAASVRIEDIAFSDPRIELLGSIAGYNRFEALGRLAHLWRACTERETPLMTEAFIIGALGQKGVEALTQSGLGERNPDGIRVRGCEGRIEWLGKRRRASRSGGEANAKRIEAKGEPNDSQTNPNGSPPSPSPSPSPSLTLTLIPTPSPTVDFARAFEVFWNAYPNKARKNIAQREWDCLPLTPQLVSEIMAGLARWQQSAQWAKDGGQFIPAPAKWLNEYRWTETPPQHNPSAPNRNGKLTIAEHIAMRQREKEQASK